MLKSSNNIAIWIQQNIKKNHIPWSSGIHSTDARMVQYLKINKHNIPHKQNEGQKYHIITSIDAEKTSDKIQHPLMIKDSQPSGNRGSIPQNNKIESYIQETYSQYYTQWA